MSSLTIRDLPERRALDRKSMSAVRGGNNWLAGLGPAAKIDIGISQNIAQLQNIEVNALNNNGVIGAGFGPLSLNVSPKQWANAEAVI
jgi:hypothetical protein